MNRLTMKVINRNGIAAIVGASALCAVFVAVNSLRPNLRRLPSGASGKYLLSWGNGISLLTLSADGVHVEAVGVAGVWTDKFGLPVIDRVNKRVFAQAGAEQAMLSRITYEEADFQYKAFDHSESLAISPDGSKLFYVDSMVSAESPNRFVLRETDTGHTRGLQFELHKFSRLVWISNHEMLFTDPNLNLVVVDIDTGELMPSGVTGVFPSSVSPDKTKVVCFSHDSSVGFIYDVGSRTISSIGEGFFSGSVWSGDSGGFLYNKYSLLSNPLKDSPDIYYYLLDDGTSILILRYTTFFDGVLLPENWHEFLVPPAG